MERPLLLLDLDETLIWASVSEPPSGSDFRVAHYFVTRRPHLGPFLETVCSWFAVAVWTSSGDKYAEGVVREVFADPSQLEFMWSASRCTRRRDDETGEEYWLKDLKKVRRRGYDLARVLMIDDSPEKLRRHYGNHLALPPFEGDPADRVLVEVLPFLDWIRDQPDFRRIEKRDWRRRGIELPGAASVTADLAGQGSADPGPAAGEAAPPDQDTGSS